MKPLEALQRPDTVRLLWWIHLLNMADASCTLLETYILGVQELNPIMRAALGHSFMMFLAVKVGGVYLCAGILAFCEQKTWLFILSFTLGLVVFIHMVLLGQWGFCQLF